MQQVGGGVVAHRVGASFGVHDRPHRLAHRDPTVQRAPVDDEPADRALGIGDGEQQLVGGGVADGSRVADLPSTLGIEGRLVEHQLGRGRGVDPQLDLGARLQLLVARGIANDGYDPGIGGGRRHTPGIWCPRLTGRCRHTARSPRPGATGRPCGRSGTGCAAPRGRPRIPPGRPARRTRRRARPSGRWESRTCRAAGTPPRPTAPGHRRAGCRQADR